MYNPLIIEIIESYWVRERIFEDNASGDAKIIKGGSVDRLKITLVGSQAHKSENIMIPRPWK